jgi:hypothetical protein
MSEKTTPLVDQLLAELTTKKEKKAKAGKYILEINGKIITKRMTKKELIKQVRALACTTADINVFKLEGSVTTDIPVSINAIEGGE